MWQERSSDDESLSKEEKKKKGGGVCVGPFRVERVRVRMSVGRLGEGNVLCFGKQHGMDFM